MKDKNYYIDLLEHRIISFNPCWEPQMKESKLRTNTEESIELLKSYFNTIKIIEKQFDKNFYDKTDYTKYPDNLKAIIKSIIDIINDGRDLHKPIEWKGRTYDHHINLNGYLSFENNPFAEVNWCDSFLDDLSEIIKSEKETIDFNKFINGKWYLFQGYESGSVSVRFEKINKDKNGIFTFDGDMIFWATIDSKYDGDGIIINKEVEDCSFAELPYCREHLTKDEDVVNYIEGAETVETDAEIKNEVHRIMDEYLNEIYIN